MNPISCQPNPPAVGAAVVDDRRFASLSRLYGQAALDQLAQAHVVVVGIGGVGSWAAEALIRSGIGTLTVIDFDHISVSNINRQVHASETTLGQSKVLAMQTRLLEINPQAIVKVIDDFVTPDNWPDVLGADLTHVNAIVDCCDQFSAKLAMAHWALTQPRKTRPLLVCAGAAGGKTQAQSVEVADLSEVTHDPLLAKMRYQLRRQAKTRLPTAALAKKPAPIGLTCVFSRQPMLTPSARQGTTANATGAALNCQGYGSSVMVTASFGMVMAGVVVDALSKSTQKNFLAG